MVKCLININCCITKASHCSSWLTKLVISLCLTPVRSVNCQFSGIWHFWRITLLADGCLTLHLRADETQTLKQKRTSIQRRQSLEFLKTKGPNSLWWKMSVFVYSWVKNSQRAHQGSEAIFLLTEAFWSLLPSTSSYLSLCQWDLGHQSYRSIVS